MILALLIYQYVFLMKRTQCPCLSVIVCLFMLSSGYAFSDEIRVAVASNFSPVMKNLAARFEENTGHIVTLISGSTGKHYAQIKHGAPFHAFFSADVERAKRLEEEGDALVGSRFTYAIGHLVLWSPEAAYVDASSKVLERAEYRHLAIANPKLAPYGKAAQEVLQTMGLWSLTQARLVRGENISQTFQFVKSGNAELGFVAYSQLKPPTLSEPSITGSFWLVPQQLYTPIEQQVVLLQDNSAARDFLLFVKSETSQSIIQRYGYSTP